MADTPAPDGPAPDRSPDPAPDSAPVAGSSSDSAPGPTSSEDGTGRSRPRTWVRWLLTLVGLLVVVVGGVLVWWIGWAPDTEQAPLEAAMARDDVTVGLDDGEVTIEPTDGDGPLDGDTLVFYPGARVAPDAYVATWTPVVAETGITVVIPSVPLRLAVLDVDVAASVRPDDAGGTWWLGGHSLGGTMAASYLAGEPEGDWAGIVFWGSYPNGDVLLDRDDVEVLSVSGTRDGLSTPEDIEASRADLPASSTFVALDGVNHAQFGAYGSQSGDLEPEVDDETARMLVADATAEFLVGSAPGE